MKGFRKTIKKTLNTTLHFTNNITQTFLMEKLLNDSIILEDKISIQDFIRSCSIMKLNFDNRDRF